jgi:SNF2 family DNA or RNA helicase
MTLLAVATNPALLSAKDGPRALLNFRWPLSGYAPQDDIADLIENYASSEIPWKFQWLRAYAEQMKASDKKILIWTNFVGNIKALEILLQPVSPVTVFGQHSASERSDSLNRFRNDKDCTALITNAQTLGEGVSLHDVCHDAVYIDRSFNAGLYLQSQDRIHRLGLPANTETNITMLVSNGTIDEDVELRLSRKVSQMARLLNDASLSQSASARPYDPDEDVMGVKELLDLDHDDLKYLFEHIRN